MNSAALIDGPYRYWLTRDWRPVDSADTRAGVLWVMLNPSTADHTQDDPTIRKCIGFTERLGFKSLAVVNLFAYRATDPRQLEHAESHAPFDVVGPRNDGIISKLATVASVVVCAWGAFETKNFAVRYRAEIVKQLLAPARKVICLGYSKASRQPRHPLMLPYTSAPQPWPERGA